MHKDSITGEQVIDYDFFGKKLYPPKKLKITDAGKEFAALFRELDSFYYPRKKEFNNDRTSFVRGHAEYKQPCTVKMYYTENKQNHIEFLRNYMPQNNKKEVIDKPKLFNAFYEEVPESELLKYEQEADDLGFKFIISPESQNIDMKALVRQFVKKLEGVTGHKFSWLAVTHTNTAHIHSHLLINGIDKNTKEKFRFESGIVKSVARGLAIDICTDLAGPRSQEQIEASRLNLPYANRWVPKLDQHIIDYYGYTQFKVSHIVGNCEFEASKVTVDELERQRLNHLVDMGLAIFYDRNNPPVYYLEKGWKEKLRAIGRYNTYLDARNKLRFTPFYNLELYEAEHGEVSGFVSRIYNMDDEGIWNNAVVIENRKLNKAWYVPTRIKLKEDDIGKFISVKTEKNQKGKLRPVITITN
ncbi:relaxase/mobilization nuclease domain-containing protein [Treponema pectinovorum]|uniref:relaxase/mobilization nuclease domain-containing protein n=1 Tax=Treponema pectinovorum TaxID=164 RepID=UPI0011F2D010|nr:relaxase/mobilization nuclease domain-containing protein [Treponema pectinovorum]